MADWLAVAAIEGSAVGLVEEVEKELWEAAALLLGLAEGSLVMLGLLLGRAGLIEGLIERVAVELTAVLEGVLLGVLLWVAVFVGSGH